MAAQTSLTLEGKSQTHSRWVFKYTLPATCVLTYISFFFFFFWLQFPRTIYKFVFLFLNIDFWYKKLIFNDIYETTDYNNKVPTFKNTNTLQQILKVSYPVGICLCSLLYLYPVVILLLDKGQVLAFLAVNWRHAHFVLKGKQQMEKLE